MSELKRREFLTTLGGAVTGAVVAGTAQSQEPANPKKPISASQTFESNREDGRFVETAGFLQSYMKHLQIKLAFNPEMPADEFPAWREKVRVKLFELMCFPVGFPEQPPPKRLWAKQRDGYGLQKWEAYPEPYSVVPYLLLVPKGVSSTSPAPAVMCFPGSTHSKESLAGEVELDTGKPSAWPHWETNRQALAYVKKGIVSVAVENPATGETASKLQPRSRIADCSLWMGRNYLGISVFQKSCILQWLTEQSFVDASRIATSGHSLGSNPADILGVLYPNLVKAVIHNDFVCNWHERAIAGNCAPPGGSHHTVPGLFPWFDHTDLEASLAPRPLLFTEGGRTNQIDKIRQAYELVGAGDRLQVFHYAKYANPVDRPYEGKPLPEGVTAEEYLAYANVDAPMHRFRPDRAVPWLASVFGL
jgi:hypothetical protein